MTPSAVRAIRNEDPGLLKSIDYRKGNPGLNHLRNLFVAGEHCDIQTIKWLQNGVPDKVRVSDSWWQTETGWAITSCCLGYPDGRLRDKGLISSLGSAGLPVPGYNVHCVEQKEGNTSAQAIGSQGYNDGSEGEDLRRILVKLPTPPGMVTTLWNDDKRFKELYFSEYPVC